MIPSPSPIRHFQIGDSVIYKKYSEFHFSVIQTGYPDSSDDSSDESEQDSEQDSDTLAELGLFSYLSNTETHSEEIPPISDPIDSNNLESQTNDIDLENQPSSNNKSLDSKSSTPNHQIISLLDDFDFSELKSKSESEQDSDLESDVASDQSEPSESGSDPKSEIESEIESGSDPEQSEQSEPSESGSEPESEIESEIESDPESEQEASSTKFYWGDSLDESHNYIYDKQTESKRKKSVFRKKALQLLSTPKYKRKLTYKTIKNCKKVCSQSFLQVFQNLSTFESQLQFKNYITEIGSISYEADEIEISVLEPFYVQPQFPYEDMIEFPLLKESQLLIFAPGRHLVVDAADCVLFSRDFGTGKSGIPYKPTPPFNNLPKSSSFEFLASSKQFKIPLSSHQLHPKHSPITSKSQIPFEIKSDSELTVLSYFYPESNVFFTPSTIDQVFALLQFMLGNSAKTLIPWDQKNWPLCKEALMSHNTPAFWQSPHFLDPELRSQNIYSFKKKSKFISNYPVLDNDQLLEFLVDKLSICTLVDSCRHTALVQDSYGRKFWIPDAQLNLSALNPLESYSLVTDFRLAPVYPGQLAVLNKREPLSIYMEDRFFQKNTILVQVLEIFPVSVVCIPGPDSMPILPDDTQVPPHLLGDFMKLKKYLNIDRVSHFFNSEFDPPYLRIPAPQALQPEHQSILVPDLYEPCWVNGTEKTFSYSQNQDFRPDFLCLAAIDKPGFPSFKKPWTEEIFETMKQSVDEKNESDWKFSFFGYPPLSEQFSIRRPERIAVPFEQSSTPSQINNFDGTVLDVNPCDFYPCPDYYPDIGVIINHDHPIYNGLWVICSYDSSNGNCKISPANHVASVVSKYTQPLLTIDNSSLSTKEILQLAKITHKTIIKRENDKISLNAFFLDKLDPNLIIDASVDFLETITDVSVSFMAYYKAPNKPAISCFVDKILPDSNLCIRIPKLNKTPLWSPHEPIKWKYLINVPCNHFLSSPTESDTFSPVYFDLTGSYNPYYPMATLYSPTVSVAPGPEGILFPKSILTLLYWVNHTKPSSWKNDLLNFNNDSDIGQLFKEESTSSNDFGSILDFPPLFTPHIFKNTQEPTSKMLKILSNPFTISLVILGLHDVLSYFQNRLFSGTFIQQTVEYFSNSAVPPFKQFELSVFGLNDALNAPFIPHFRFLIQCAWFVSSKFPHLNPQLTDPTRCFLKHFLMHRKIPLFSDIEEEYHAELESRAITKKFGFDSLFDFKASTHISSLKHSIKDLGVNIGNSNSDDDVEEEESDTHGSSSESDDDEITFASPQSAHHPGLYLCKGPPPVNTFISDYRYISGPPTPYVLKQYSSIQHSKPWGIYLFTFHSHMNVFLGVVRGAADTPYRDILFLFEIILHSHTQNPPFIRYIHQAPRSINPNLYPSGKICLSLLGTWTGSGSEKWNSKSTLAQLLLSIQGIVLCGKPYFNEAGYEKYESIPSHQRKSWFYNETVILNCYQQVISQFSDKSFLGPFFRQFYLAHKTDILNRINTILASKPSSLPFNSDQLPTQYSSLFLNQLQKIKISLEKVFSSKT